jgi:SAM-dependent methyltransferase
MRKTCEACGSTDLIAFKLGKTIAVADLSSDKVKVTNKDYGMCVEMLKCAKCGLVQSKELLSDQQILGLYSGMEDAEYVKESELRGNSNYEQVKNIISDYTDPLLGDVNILEIGCGSGGLITELSEIYKNINGIEPSSYLCSFARNHYGLDIQNIGYEQIATDKKYKVIIALDVIEHVVSSQNFMTTIAKLLEPGGIAIIGTPDFNSVARKILGGKWWHIRPPHLYYFDRSNFKKLVERNGLHLIGSRYFYWTLPFEYLFDSLQEFFFKKSFISLFPDLAIKVKFFDSLVFVVKK